MRSYASRIRRYKGLVFLPVEVSDVKKQVANLAMLCAVLAMIVVSGAAGPGVAFGQSNVVTTDVRIPVEYKVSLPCEGKEVQLTGEIKAQFRVSGGSYLEGDISYGGISGTVLPNGSKYEGAGTSLFDYSGLTKQEFTFVGTFVLNRPKSYESLIGRAKFRIRVNRKGEVTAVVQGVELDCPN